jgi:hypothetical protein
MKFEDGKLYGFAAVSFCLFKICSLRYFSRKIKNQQELAIATCLITMERGLIIANCAAIMERLQEKCYIALEWKMLM